MIAKERQHGGSMSDALIASIAAILVALLGAGLSFVQTRRLQRRQARLARLNAQLEELYGPIYATLEASRIAYRRLLAWIHRSIRGVFGRVNVKGAL
jgi:hypothetical protein